MLQPIFRFEIDQLQGHDFVWLATATVDIEGQSERFRSLVSLVVGINQFTFAFGPLLVGVVRDWAGAYEAGVGACVVLQAAAAVMLLRGPGRVPSTILGGLLASRAVHVKPDT